MDFFGTSTGTNWNKEGYSRPGIQEKEFCSSKNIFFLPNELTSILYKLLCADMILSCHTCRKCHFSGDFVDNCYNLVPIAEGELPSC